jgi:hypothetical protein
MLFDWSQERIMEARPVLVGLGKARDVIPGMCDTRRAAPDPSGCPLGRSLGASLWADAGKALSP